MSQSIIPAPIKGSIRRPGFLAVLNAERIKFFSLKVGPITTAVLGSFIVFSALLSSLALVMSSPNQASSDASTSISEVRFVDTVLWMAIAYAVVSVLFATSEYTSGQISLSFLASPKRTPMVLAKVGVIGVLGFFVGAVASSLAMLVPLVVVSGSEFNYEFDLRQFTVLAAASGLFMGFIGIVSLAIGLLVKKVIVAIFLPVLLFSILPSILESIGNEVVTKGVGFLPSVAGRVMLTTFPNAAGLDAWQGMAVLSGWAVVLVALASVVLRVRDT